LIVAIFVPIALTARSGIRDKTLPALPPSLALGAVIAVGLITGMTRMTLTGSAGRVFSWTSLVPAGANGTFFAGLSAGPRLAAIERDISAVSAEMGRGKTGVFFGPALEYAYAAHGYTPPLGLPAWWHSGTSYAPAQFRQIAARFAANPPAVAIFILNDWEGMPPWIYDQLRADYSRRDVGTLMVFEARTVRR
jgi:hypothetical protein